MEKKNFLNRVKIKDFQAIQDFKKKFEDGQVSEEKIPEAYKKSIRKLYIQQIQEFRQRLNK